MNSIIKTLRKKIELVNQFGSATAQGDTYQI